MDLLARSVAFLEEMGFRPVNVDVTVICERPRLAPVADGIRKSLARILGLRPEDVSLKGKTNEGMGWIGAGEGLAVHAVALVEEVDPEKV